MAYAREFKILNHTFNSNKLRTNLFHLKTSFFLALRLPVLRNVPKWSFMTLVCHFTNDLLWLPIAPFYYQFSFKEQLFKVSKIFKLYIYLLFFICIHKKYIRDDNKETQGKIIKQEIHIVYKFKPHILIIVSCFSFDPEVKCSSS